MVVEPTTAPPAGAALERIAALRARIDEIDAEIIQRWLERRAVAEEIGAIRVAAGGPRVVQSREYEILERFRGAIDGDGASLGLLLLKAGRGLA